MKRKGFTVIEMLIVMAIIGALAMLIMPYFIRAKFKADTTNCMGNEKTIATALEIKKNSSGYYPKTLEKLQEDFTLSRIPVCPSNSESYSKTYQVTDDLDRFTIYCPGIHYKLLKYEQGYPQFSSESGLSEGSSK